MKWIKLTEKAIKAFSSDDKLMDFGCFLLISEHGQYNQGKIINGTFYHDFDHAKHYPLTKKQMKGWEYIMKIKNPEGVKNSI